MSSGSVGKLNEDCGKSKQHSQSPQIAWMSRWMRPSYSKSAQSPCSPYRVNEVFDDVGNLKVGESKSREAVKPNVTNLIDRGKAVESRTVIQLIPRSSDEDDPMQGVPKLENGGILATSNYLLETRTKKKAMRSFRRTLDDSVECLCGVGFPRFSHTTQRLLIAEEADVSVSHHSSSFLRLSAFFSRDVVRVLRPMAIRNESLSETDAMDLLSSKEMNSLSAGLGSKTSLKRQTPDIELKLPFLQPGNRWVKRLKVSSSNYSVVPDRKKNSGLSEDEFMAEVLKAGHPSSEQRLGKESLKKDKELIVEVDSKGKVVLLLSQQPWIKRWLRSKEKKPEIDDNVRKERLLPSVGAMALMGKAMNGFELKKKGCFTTWNTKSF